MTAQQLIERYRLEYDDMLPPEGNEYAELSAFAARLGVTCPDADSVVATVQQYRTWRNEANAKRIGWYQWTA